MAEELGIPDDDPEPTLRGTLTGSGATPLAFARWELPEPRGRVVIAHGYGEHGERYRHTAQWLNRLGWAVSTLDHRGFGRSGGVRGDVRGVQAPVEDLTLFLRHERLYDAARLEAARPGAAPDTFPQILLGHSFGGLLALLVLLWHPDTLEGLIVSSPALRLRRLAFPLRALQALAHRVFPHRPLNLPGDKSQVCSDPAMVRRYEEDPLCHRYISAGFLAAMAEGARELTGFGAELDRPILLLEAGRDTVVDPDGAEPLWAEIRPRLLERHRLEGFFHEIFHDQDRAEAERLAAQWLDRQFPAGNGAQAPQSATL
ncbi:MAG: lysophospholipase [Holophaga sp.]|jgi:alpha-beta hydrolase superfamily lysophospholipase